jgi:hypothetical protein
MFKNEILSRFSPAQLAEARACAMKWDDQDRHRRAWSAPLALQVKGGEWFFWVVPTLMDLDEDFEVCIDLRALTRD